MLIDTDVLIWYMRGNENAFEFIENLEEFSISSITYMELLQGMRNKRELNALKKALVAWNARLLQINENISTLAISYMESHFLSHSLQLADAIIAATASFYDLTLVTGNEKHYRIIPNLKIQKFHP